MDQLQMSFETHAPEVMELGQFSYLRPKRGDADYEQWLGYFAAYYHAAIRNGRSESEDLYRELAAYADHMHCSIFAMKAGEMMVEAMTDEEFRNFCERTH